MDKSSIWMIHVPIKKSKTKIQKNSSTVKTEKFSIEKVSIHLLRAFLTNQSKYLNI